MVNVGTFAQELRSRVRKCGGILALKSEKVEELSLSIRNT